ncbi:substrate-binding periplasmic protein [Vibrio algarum]|uniref:Transporter substrate-binding domain-containing protein n=1 Tax=Vibrio algarum TaxID=3020714 RepID=A0ABT4YWP1_9VIBR|nr:transporter substrate-binding domain-containing protein [Vibrio sp. KJ40-1]MDB1125989.1 transporter substrate-binding domain-containing protein [Vibrio sp. KJ40-1]
MRRYSLKILLFSFFLLRGTSLYAQDILVISTMAKTGATEPVSMILRQAYQQIGIEIQIRQAPGKRSLFNANSGKADGEAYRIIGLESNFSNLVRVDVPVREENMYFYVKKGGEFDVTGWENFPGNLTLGYIRGTYFVERAAIVHHIKVQPSSHYEHLLKQLNANRNDVIIMSNQGEPLIRKLNLNENIIRLEPPAHSFALYHYLHKRNINVIPKITESLKQMQTSGQIQKINDEN